MKLVRQLGVVVGAIAIALVAMGAPGFAQAPQVPGAAGDAAVPPVPPAELQRLFDSYALVQAQQFLGISDEQYQKFLPRFMALQTARRQALQQRTRLLNMIRKAVNESQPDDQIKDAIKQLQDIDDRGVAETRKAQDGVDQVLDLRQQAKFRIFEEQMERRKLELVTRARQANRGR